MYDRLAAATARARIAATGTAGFSVLRCQPDRVLRLSVCKRRAERGGGGGLRVGGLLYLFCVLFLTSSSSVRAGNWRREHPILAPRRSTCLKGAKNGLIECINGKDILEGENQ